MAWCGESVLGAVGLGGPRLQQDGGGAPVAGGAPLQAPPLHPQLFPDLLHLRLQLALLRFQTLLLRLAEAPVASPVEPGREKMGVRALEKRTFQRSEIISFSPL